VMSAIERCRTAALGGHVERCEDCAHTRIAYNSCRNRHCPKCQGAAARDWLAEREAELLPVPYFHLVFTLPAAIADIASQNKAVIYDLLFKASSEALLTIAADPKHLGAQIGITAVLHTWGSAMTHHPHVHMIVPDGGLAADGSRWVAGSKRPFAGPQAVLAYLARDTHRVAIANRRLIAADDDGVTFTWKDYRFEGRDRHKTMTLAPHEFIRRFLLHVLPRHYGLLASAARRANIARVRELLAAPKPPTLPEPTTKATATAPTDHRPPCPSCGGRMIVVETFERGGGPRDPPSSEPRIRTEAA